MAPTFEGNTVRIAEDDRRPLLRRYRTVHETLAALAAMLDELLSDTVVEIGDDIEFRIVYQRDEIRVEAGPREARRGTDTQPLTLETNPLSPAERILLPYLATNLTLPLIAEQLFVSRNTVKTQSVSIYRKLGVSSRTAAIRVARDLGLLTRYVVLPPTSRLDS